MKPKMEAWVKKEVKKILVKHGIFFYMPSAALYGRAGASDFICCLDGYMLVIETKAGPSDRMTPMQEQFQEDVRKAGGFAFCIHRDNLATLETFITTDQT